MIRIAVIGSGASGISTAYYLSKLGYDVEVFEKEDRIGGRMSNMDMNGKEVSLGGKNIGKKYKYFRAFCDDMGENDFEYFGLNSSIGKGKDSRTFDSKNLLKSIISILREITIRDLLKLIPLLFVVKCNQTNGYLSGAYFKRFASEGERQGMSVGSTFSENLQRRLLRPLTIRNNGAEPDEIQMETLGTNLAMVLDSYEQLKNGTNELYKKFSEKIKIHLGVSVIEIWRENQKTVGIIRQDGEKLKFDGVVVATPATVAAKILFKTHLDISALLSEIRYFPVSVVVAKYEKPLFDSEKRAWTFPKTSILSNAGAYGKNERDIVRYTFSGRAAREVLGSDPDISLLTEIAEQAVLRYTDLPLSKCITTVGLNMKDGLCAYSLKHSSLIKKIKSSCKSDRGLFLAGDYFESVSIEGCFRSGYEVSMAVSSMLKFN